MNRMEEVAPGPLACESGRECRYSNTPIVPGLAREAAKTWRTIQAQCLLEGFKADLIEGDDGRPQLIVSRWALCRSFSTPDEAATWLARVAPSAVAGVAP